MNFKFYFLINECQERENFKDLFGGKISKSISKKITKYFKFSMNSQN